jgi:hypothetical protein
MWKRVLRAWGIAAAFATGFVVVGGTINNSNNKTSEAQPVAEGHRNTEDARDAALAKEARTTPEAIRKMRQGFEAAGVSGEGFDALIDGMSRQSKQDYLDMMENVRTSAARRAEAERAVREAEENWRRAYGLPPN